MQTKTKTPEKIAAPDVATQNAPLPKQAGATPLPKNAVVSSPNGLNYKVTGDGKVKKVNNLSEIFKLDIEALTDTGSLNKALFKFLKDQDPSEDTRVKNGWIYCRGYRMKYTAEGIQITDTLNFGNNVSDQFSDMPTPKEIWDLISVPKVIPIIKRIKVTDPRTTEIPANLDLKEAKEMILSSEEFSEFKVRGLYKKIVKDKDIAEEVREYFKVEMEKKYSYLIEKEELDFTKLRKRAIKLLDKEPKAEVVIPKIKALLPNRSFNVFFGKLIRKLKNKEIRVRKFYSELLILLQNDEVFEEKKKPAPKFVGCSSYRINEYHGSTDTDVKFTNEAGTFTVAKSLFIAKYLLEEYPELNIGVMKFLRKEITQEQFIEEPIIKDKFCEFDFKLLNNHDQELYDALIDIMFDWEVANPLLMYYSNMVPATIVKGTKLMIVWNDNHARYEATVTDTKSGISVRYTDGSVDKLFTFQPFKIIK